MEALRNRLGYFYLDEWHPITEPTLDHFNEFDWYTSPLPAIVRKISTYSLINSYLKGKCKLISPRPSSGMEPYIFNKLGIFATFQFEDFMQYIASCKYTIPSVIEGTNHFSIKISEIGELINKNGVFRWTPCNILLTFNHSGYIGLKITGECRPGIKDFADCEISGCLEFQTIFFHTLMDRSSLAIKSIGGVAEKWGRYAGS